MREGRNKRYIILFAVVLSVTAMMISLPAFFISVSADDPIRPPIVTDGDAGPDVKYKLDINNVNSISITFTGSGTMYDYEDPAKPPDDPLSKPPPWSQFAIKRAFFEEGITSVGKSTFRYNNDLSYVSLPDGLKSIGQNAFSGTSITEIVIPDTVVSIGVLAMTSTHLVSISVPDSVTEIGGSAFAKNLHLDSVTIGDGVRVLSQGLVADTPRLSSLTIGSGVELIERWLTSGSGLRSIYIPENVIWISPEAFSARSVDSLEHIDVNPQNMQYSSIDGILYNKDQTEIIRFLPKTDVAEYTISEGVQAIAPFAFYLCSSLNTVIMPNTLTYIGNNAFGLCTGITALSIPDSVTQIDVSGVNTGGVLEYLYIGSGVGKITGTMVPSIRSVVNLHLGSGISSVDLDSIRANPYLKSITVDAQSDYFASMSGSFYNSNVTQLLAVPNAMEGHFILPNSVTHIGDNVFRYTSIESITLSSNLSVIGNGSFAGTSITTIKVPLNIKIIGGDAFVGCSDLMMVYFESNSPPSIGQNAFDTGSEGLRVYSTMGTGFLDRYAGDVTITYFDSEIVYEDIIDEISNDNIFILAAFLIVSVLLIITERALSRRNRK